MLLARLYALANVDDLPEKLDSLTVHRLPQISDLSVLPDNVTSLEIMNCHEIQILPIRPSITSLTLSLSHGQVYQVYTLDGQSVIEGREVSNEEEYFALRDEIQAYMLNRKKRAQA